MELEGTAARAARRTWLRGARRGIRRELPAVLQIVAAGGLAILVALLLGFDKPVGAPLFAITTLEFVCARHRRSIAIFFFGMGFGLALAALAAGYRSLDRILLDLVAGSRGLQLWSGCCHDRVTT